jgi:linoleoyl-CoA desaturase
MDVDADGTALVDLAGLWRSMLPTATEIRSARRRLHLKATCIAVLVATTYWGLVIADLGTLPRLACAALLVVGLVAVATSIMHDANHGAFSRWPWLNRLASYTGDALGLSSWLWRFKHNSLHHGSPNVEGIDSDIAQAPFARLSPGQPWRAWHRLQHIYLWPLYGFMAMKNLLIGDFKNLATRRVGDQPLRSRPGVAVVLRILAGKLVHVGWAVVVPLAFNPWWVVLAFYVCMSWLVGFTLAVTFQLAHCVEGAAFVDTAAPHRGPDFVPHQLRTTANVACAVPVLGSAFRWIVGGLDHQIEHHLAPRLPHTIYPALGARFRRACDGIGTSYRIHSGVWAALCSHARWLKQMSRPTAALT